MGMHSGERWRLGRRPALDGLRGVAVLMVVIGHAAGGYRLFALSSGGVSVFFALSGFLITCLLLEERHRDGSVSLGGFYQRRARRLLPALAVMLLVVGSVQVAAGTFSGELYAAVVFYVGNWFGVAGHSMGPLNHTWSLAVEEQFYILWPLVLIVVRRRFLVPVIVAGIAVSAALRVTLLGADRLYLGSDTQAGALLVGCLLAALAHRGLPELRARWVSVVGIVLLGSLVLGGGNLGVAVVLVPTFVPVVAAAMIWAGCCRPAAWLTAPALRYVGRRSYAVYLWHLPVVMGARALWPGSALAVAGGVMVTFLVAEASWRLVESPFLRPATVQLRGLGQAAV